MPLDMQLFIVSLCPFFPSYSSHPSRCPPLFYFPATLLSSHPPNPNTSAIQTHNKRYAEKERNNVLCCVSHCVVVIPLVFSALLLAISEQLLCWLLQLLVAADLKSVNVDVPTWKGRVASPVDVICHCTSD